MIKGFFGINIAVKDLDEASEKYTRILGVQPIVSGSEAFSFPGLKGVSYVIGTSLINLVASEQPGTSIAKFIETHGEGVFLASIEVTDLVNDMKDFQDRGMKFIVDQPLTSADGRFLAAWCHPKMMNGVQWELVQFK